MSYETIAYNISNIPCVLSHVEHFEKYDTHIFEVSFNTETKPEFESLNKWIKAFYATKPEDDRPKACVCFITKDDEVIKCLRVPIKH